MTNGNPIALTLWNVVSRVMSLLFSMLSRFIIVILPRSKYLLILWQQSPSIVILEPRKRTSLTVSTFSPYICHENMELYTMILVVVVVVVSCWVSSQLFHSPLSPSSRGSLVPLHFLPLEWYHLHIWGCWYFSRLSWSQVVIPPPWHFTWCTLHIS